MDNLISKSKPISLYWFSYRKSYYLTHPHVFFQDLWTGAKNAIHRMRYGFAWVDLWNMDSYLLELIPNMLRELSARSCGIPYSYTEEEYKSYLNSMALLFEYCQIPNYVEEYKAAPSAIQHLHSEISICERLYARAATIVRENPETWQLELTKFCFAELGSMTADGLLWD